MDGNKVTEKNKETKERTSFSRLLFRNLFGGRRELSIFEEEEVQGPWRTVFATFLSNKMAMTGLVIFLLIFLT
ncbi:MAG TPA: hypothetical protein VK031_08365, partial [Tissierellaceae bacterium]|nr:hypothetical protein [Tissierellaceae bacterium]